MLLRMICHQLENLNPHVKVCAKLARRVPGTAVIPPLALDILSSLSTCLVLIFRDLVQIFRDIVMIFHDFGLKFLDFPLQAHDLAQMSSRP